jgi:hypothetical protein
MRFIATLFFCLAVASGAASASAETCPGNPDALGTSRVLTISPSKFSQIGSMQYRQTLPLNDHEVVITFDDGLPSLLKELKARGFHVVQVVPAGDRPKSVPELTASPATDKGAWPTVLRARQF